MHSHKFLSRNWKSFILCVYLVGLGTFSDVQVLLTSGSLLAKFQGSLGSQGSNPDQLVERRPISTVENELNFLTQFVLFFRLMTAQIY